MATSTIFGSSVGGNKGALTLSAEQSRFGVASIRVIRQFTAGLPGNIPSGITTSQVLFYSFKGNATNFTAMAAGTWDTAIVTWLRALPAGLNVKLTYYHEPENDAWTIAQFQAAQNHFNNLVHTTTGIVANVKTCLILMAITLTGFKGRVTDNYWTTTHPPDEIAFDFDGVSGFYDWSSIVTLAAQYAAKKGVAWSVGEFGVSDISSDDPTHAQRAAYNANVASQFAAAGASYVMYWDDGDVVLTGSAEITQWAGLMSQTPSTKPAAPIGVTATPASDGQSVTIGWATIPAGVDHLDAYLQGPGQTYPHRVNASPIPVSPRAYSTPTTPGQTYSPGAFLVASADSAGTNRSGFSAGVAFSAPNPGSTNHSPIIQSVVITADPVNPLLQHLAATATDPDSDPIFYDWAFTDPSDPLGAAVHLLSASGDITFQTDGIRDYTLTVTDHISPPTIATGQISMNVQGTNSSPYLQMPMMQAGVDIRQIGPVDRSAKIIADDRIRRLVYRRSPHNAVHNLNASTFAPWDISGSGVITPAAGDFWFVTMLMEGDTLAKLACYLTQSQVGTGVIGGFHDPTSGLLVDPGTFSMDTMFQSAVGRAVMDVPAPLTQLVPGEDLVTLGFWFPNTGGPSTLPKLRSSVAGGTSQNAGGGGNRWGTIISQTSYPTTINFGSAIVNPLPYIAVPIVG